MLADVHARIGYHTIQRHCLNAFAVRDFRAIVSEDEGFQANESGRAGAARAVPVKGVPK